MFTRQSLISSVCNQLRERIAKASFNIEEVKKAQKVKEEIEYRLKIFQDADRLVRKVIEKTKLIGIAATNYLTAKKEKSLKGVYSAIYLTSSIIPGNTGIISDLSRPEEFTVVNSYGDPIMITEGGAVRSILSLTLRYAIISNTEYENFFLLDEPLAVVSQEKSALFSQYLPIIGQNSQIILIGQKPEIFISADNTKEYLFTKSGGKTRVEEVVSK